MVKLSLALLMAAAFVVGCDASPETGPSNQTTTGTAGSGGTGTGGMSTGGAGGTGGMGTGGMGAGDPGVDADLDGYAGSEDCDDNDAKVFPGVSVTCTAACGDGTQTCQPDGSYTACDCVPLCEATSGRCFYVSQSAGSDDNAGTFDAPWATYLNIVSYYAPQDRPATAVALAPDDFVYFLDGTYTETYVYFNGQPAIYLRQVDGQDGAPITLKAYPGHAPVLAPNTTAITIAQSSWISVDGFEIRDTDGGGVRVEESNDVDLGRVNIHDVRGASASNIAGVSIQSSDDVTVHHSEIHDIFPSGDIEGNNLHVSHCVILFRGGNNRILYNKLWHGPAPDPRMRLGGVLYKHTAETPGQQFEVAYNTLQDMAYSSVSSGSFGSRIHHNLLINSAVFRLTDFGGPTNNSDNIISFNTIMGGALGYAPSNTYFPVGSFAFTDNIVVDSADYGEFGVVAVGKYDSDALYDEVVTGGTLTFDRNCYFNAQDTLRWDLFDANGGAYGVQGAAYDFAAWQTQGFDVNSVVVDPNLDTDFRPAEPACQARGWLAQR